MDRFLGNEKMCGFVRLCIVLTTFLISASLVYASPASFVVNSYEIPANDSLLFEDRVTHIDEDYQSNLPLVSRILIPKRYDPDREAIIGVTFILPKGSFYPSLGYHQHDDFHHVLLTGIAKKGTYPDDSQNGGVYSEEREIELELNLGYLKPGLHEVLIEGVGNPMIKTFKVIDLD